MTKNSINTVCFPHLPPLFFFFLIEAQIMQNTATGILAQISPKKPLICDEA